MLKFIENLLHLNLFLANKARSIQAYDEGLALHSAKEFKQALPLMREAAELGNTNAMSIYGSMFLLGQGVAENGKEAEVWLSRAAETGDVNAISLLGMAYATGKAGFRRDLVQGRALLVQAADKGDPQSARMLDMIEKKQGIFARRG